LHGKKEHGTQNGPFRNGFLRRKKRAQASQLPGCSRTTPARKAGKTAENGLYGGRGKHFIGCPPAQRGAGKFLPIILL